MRLIVLLSCAGSIPEALGALSELKNLDMSKNKLTGSIPRELGGLGKLEQLWLSGNELTGKGELTSVPYDVRAIPRRSPQVVVCCRPAQAS
ncbi:unnamed protein product [Ectocarpus sp. CCAP 1310/34]|nr:unnamed protein product [Ectocarpus sp. CCAP 1310/34]